MIAAIGDTESISLANGKRHDEVWGRVPAAKLAFFRAAEATIKAANGVYTPAPEGTTTSGEVYWARGYADRLIASVEAACAFWGMSEGAYVEAVERISKWFEGMGWTHLDHGLEATLAYADRAHDAGENLRRSVKADPQNAQIHAKGTARSARCDPAGQSRRGGAARP